MEKGRIRPLIGKVFPFSEALAAYTLLQNGPSPGKLVLKM
jgi:NADPH:quinone reductase-like Zn-dependent oxidoreductase